MRSSNTYIATYTTGFDIENIHAMIRQEIGYAFPSARQQAPPSNANLSPASIIAPSLQQTQGLASENTNQLLA